ncbi:hypothetical protein Q5752_006730 [Cryptotrichosporon argae]
MSKSILPQYQPIPQSEPWSALADESWQRPPSSDGALGGAHAYPPRPDGGAPVTYIFAPRYPVRGKLESVLGVLGVDKEDTIAKVQRVFPALAAYPLSRIEFLTPLSESSNVVLEHEWARIMDEAWPRFRHCPPARLKVQVVDGPGDAARRTRRNILLPLGIVLAVFGVFGAFMILVATFADS